MNTPSPGFTPKTKRLLTRPVLKFVVDVPLYLKVEGPMFVGKDIQKKGEEKKKEPATLLNVINLSTGEEAQIIVNAVVKSVLHDEYQGEAYVGKCFAITKQTRQPGKQYDPFKLEEIEDPTAAGQADAATATPIASARPVGGRK